MVKSGKGLETVDSLLLSEYILQRKEPMSHLKLQKLLYYVEAFHLAIHGTSIIEDHFEAWVHGPVSRRVYNSHRTKSILHKELSYVQVGRLSAEEKLEKLVTNDQMDTINEVIKVYGKLTALQLEALTHSEIPWIEARDGRPEADRCTNRISKKTMLNYYRKKLYGEKAD